MNAALGDELIDANPVAKGRGSTPTRNSERGKITAEQVSDILKTAEGSLIEIPLLIAATTGARRSEVLALRWSDVELEGQRIVVRRGLHRLPVGKDERGRNLYKTEFLPPKSKKALRAVPLLPEVVQRLQRHRKDQLERRLAAGTAWQDLNLVW